MSISLHRIVRAPLLSAFLLVAAAPLVAQEKAPAPADPLAAYQVISPEAKAVIDRMTVFMKSLKSYSIDSQGTRDDVVAFGYKLQENDHSTLTVQLPNKMRAEIIGDDRNRLFI